MSIDINKLELNVNLHALQPGFLNSELHYVIASDENTFRFARWDEEPGYEEEKLYCFLSEQELLIPAGNILLKQSYVLSDEPLYIVVSNFADFSEVLKTLRQKGIAKAVRNFYDEDIEAIKDELEQNHPSIKKHIVTSRQGQHTLLIFDDKEISISATMVYFRNKTPFSESHYEHIKEE